MKERELVREGWGIGKGFFYQLDGVTIGKVYIAYVSYNTIQYNTIGKVYYNICFKGSGLLSRFIPLN